jgi:roadblock/LC7 domain-containing protein
MSVYSELAGIEGVIAAGEYAYRGDRYNFKGQLSDEMARMASIMCRATTMSTHMQSEILCANSDNCPFDPAHGWVVRGPQFTVCVVANVFCFIQNESGTLNRIMRMMQERLADAHEMV